MRALHGDLWVLFVKWARSPKADLRLVDSQGPGQGLGVHPPQTLTSRAPAPGGPDHPTATVRCCPLVAGWSPAGVAQEVTSGGVSTLQTLGTQDCCSSAGKPTSPALDTESRWAHARTTGFQRCASPTELPLRTV